MPWVFGLFKFNFTNRWRFVFLYGYYKNGNLKFFNFAQSFLQFLQTLEIRLIFSFLSVFLRSMPLLFFWIQPKINFLPLKYLRLRTRGRTIEWGFFWRVLSHSCFHLFFLLRYVIVGKILVRSPHKVCKIIVKT